MMCLFVVPRRQVQVDMLLWVFTLRRAGSSYVSLRRCPDAAARTCCDKRPQCLACCCCRRCEALLAIEAAVDGYLERLGLEDEVEKDRQHAALWSGGRLLTTAPHAAHCRLTLLCLPIWAHPDAAHVALMPWLLACM